MPPSRGPDHPAPGPGRPAPVGEQGPVALTPTSWSAKETLHLGEWAEQGRRLGMIGRGVGWWIGDWLNYGNAKYGEKYTRAAKLTGYDHQTLRNMVYVASRFEPSRRRDVLSWTHHAEVAALSDEEQELWLDRAERERLSVRSLREEIVLGRAARTRRSRSAVARAGDGLVCPACGFELRTHEAVAHGDSDPPATA